MRKHWAVLVRKQIDEIQAVVWRSGSTAASLDLAQGRKYAKDNGFQRLLTYQRRDLPGRFLDCDDADVDEQIRHMARRDYLAALR